MKLVICTKFQVNLMNYVENRRGGGGPTDYFFFEASRVKNALCVCVGGGGGYGRQIVPEGLNQYSFIEN